MLVVIVNKDHNWVLTPAGCRVYQGHTWTHDECWHLLVVMAINTICECWHLLVVSAIRAIHEWQPAAGCKDNQGDILTHH